MKTVKTVLLKDAVQMLIDLEVMFKNVPVEVKICSVKIEIEMPEPVLQGIDLPMLKDMYTLRESLLILGKKYSEVSYMIRTGKIKAVTYQAGKRNMVRGITLQSLLPHMEPEVKLYYRRQIDNMKYDITRYPALIATQNRKEVIKPRHQTKPVTQKSISKMLLEAKTLPAVKAVLTHVEILNTQGKLSPRSKVSELVQQLEDIIRCYGAIGNQQLKLWIKEGAMLANKVDVENERER